MLYNVISLVNLLVQNQSWESFRDSMVQWQWHVYLQFYVKFYRRQVNKNLLTFVSLSHTTPFWLIHPIQISMKRLLQKSKKNWDEEFCAKLCGDWEGWCLIWRTEEERILLFVPNGTSFEVVGWLNLMHASMSSQFACQERSLFPLDTGTIGNWMVNVEKVVRRRPGSLMSVLLTFILRPVSKW